MTKRTKSKPPAFKAGLFFLGVFCFAMGACGSYGWLAADADPITKGIQVFASAATALVIPFTVIALGRSWASLAVLPVLAICMAVQAVSFHNFFGVVIEAPHKRDFEKGLQPLHAEVTRTTQRLDAAQAALDAFAPEKVDCSPCRNTRREAAERDETARKSLRGSVDVAKADRQSALAALEAAQAKYQPMAPDSYVWTVGGLLDFSIALAIWGLEMTALKLRKKPKDKTAKAKKPKRKAPAKKPVPMRGFKPYVAVSNT